MKGIDYNIRKYKKKEESSHFILDDDMNFQHTNMISLKMEIFNINVHKYFECCLKLEVIAYSCPTCSCPGALVKHGYYKRTVIINGIKQRVTILRVKCKSCGKTHALLPSFIIPYLQTSLRDAMLIINNTIDSNRYYYKKNLIRKSYKKWINRVLSVFSSLSHAFLNLNNLVIQCSIHFQLCFLQNHKGKYYTI